MKGKAGGKIETQNQNRRREKVARGEWKKGVARAERRDEGRDQRAEDEEGGGKRVQCAWSEVALTWADQRGQGRPP